MYDVLIGFKSIEEASRSAIFPGFDFTSPDNFKYLRLYRFDKNQLTELTAVETPEAPTNEIEGIFQTNIIRELILNYSIDSVTIGAVNSTVLYNGIKPKNGLEQTFSRHFTKDHPIGHR